MNTASSGVGLGLGGGIGIGGARTTGVHVTELARKVAPPTPLRMVTWVIAGFFVAAFINAALPPAVAWLGGLLVIALPIAAGFWVRKHNREVYVPAYAQWERKFMCDRCGEAFTL